MKRILLTTTILAACALPASASIALFVDGRHMRIEAYAVDAETIHLTMAGGGTLSLPLARIERIVDDEVTTPELEQEVQKIAEDGVFPERSWRYSEQSQPLFKSQYNPFILAAARKFDVDAALIAAVIKAESDYNPRTVSRKGAEGLMQLMPATAIRFGVTDAFDPEQNIHAGTRYLRWLLDYFGNDVELALAGYNAGEGNVKKYKGVPPFRETVIYLQRIARHIRNGIDSNVIAASPVPAHAGTR